MPLSEHGSDLRVEDYETLNFKGCFCPRCGASDRDRLYALYLHLRLGTVPISNFRLLDVAPARALSKHIRLLHGIQYRTADLNREDVDDRVDLTRMDCYPDASFNAFICSHVLEHILDDRAAMAELYRILKPGGWGIATVPVNTALREIREDPSRKSAADRWKYFGQNDHVRVYTAKGFCERLQRAGFRVLNLGAEFFGNEKFARCGITERSVLYVVEK